MQTINAITYPVHFEEDNYSELSKLIRKKKYSSIFVLVDEHTKADCYPILEKKMGNRNDFKLIEIRSGEIEKNLSTCMQVWNEITNLGGDRKSLLITLGGGVITDLGGFCASCFKRGIDFVNIPTTLLSMVDASVGGKTGVDLGVLKNQIGLFANPKMVIVDDVYLKTLPQKEIRSGTAEIIKYGLTYDISLFRHIQKHKTDSIHDLIYRSVEIKNQVVLEDPKEKYLRKVLNYGHTIGHAIESFYLESEDKPTLTHGEAIAIGMVCEAFLSHKLLDFPLKYVEEIKSVVLSIYKKISLKANDYNFILDLLKHDKKNEKGVVKFVLLKNYQSFQIDCEVPNDLIRESLDYYIL